MITKMEDNDRISGDQGSIKPEETLTDIVRKVAKNRETNEQAPMRAAANGALVRWLKEVEGSDIEADQMDLEYALGKHGFDTVNELVEALFDAGEPIMAGSRMDLAEIDPEELDLQDGNPGFELSEPGDTDG